MSTKRDAYAKAIAALAEIKVDLVSWEEAGYLSMAMQNLQEARNRADQSRLDIKQ